MTHLPDIKDALEKVLKAIQEDRTLLERRIRPVKENTITVENLECVAGNHLFDGLPGLFGITKMQGHKIRAYFQEGASSRNWDIVYELHNEFPEYMNPERQEFLDRINKYRKSQNLSPITFALANAQKTDIVTQPKSDIVLNNNNSL